MPLSGEALHHARLRAREEQQRRRKEQERVLSNFSYDVRGFIEEYFNWVPWSTGDVEYPGQGEIIDEYQRIIRTQIEKADVENGLITLDECREYVPGQVIQKVLHIEKGHNTGGTKICSALVNHFLHSFTPSIVYTYAPGWKQIKNLLWKEIISDRKGSGLPGKTLSGSLRIEITPEHFATGVATKNLSTEDVQGQHQQFLLFVLDEAEGIPDFVYKAIQTMASGGVVVIIMLANPRTRTSTFHQYKSKPETVSVRMSCIYHPNVLQNRNVVPGAVTRQHVCNMVRDHCVEPNGIQEKHSEEDFTFTLPYPVTYHTQDGAFVRHSMGTIFKPDGDFMYQVLGIPPAHGADDVLVSIGRYEAAQKRALRTLDKDPAFGTIGCDVARFGSDKGAFFSRHKGVVRKFAGVDDAITDTYVRLITAEAKRMKDAGCTHLSIRVDGTGGFGAGVIDGLRGQHDLWLIWFDKLEVHEVHFGGSPYAKKEYKNIITECYAQANETLLGVRLRNVPKELEVDLTDRKYDWKNVAGIDVKVLEEKKYFKKRNERSPDDGDAAVLCMAPEFIFKAKKGKRARGGSAKR